MSGTLKLTNIQNPSAASPNIVLDANGNATVAGTVAMATPYGSRNKIINGDFNVAQRGTSFSGTATEYTVDRWRFLNSGVSASKSVVRQAFAQGQSFVPKGTAYYMDVSAGSVSGVGISTFDQPIEDVITLAGQTVTVSFYAKGSISGTVKVGIVNYFGSGGSSTTISDTVTGSFNVTTSWARHTVTLNVPDYTGKTIGPGSANDLHFVLYSESTQFFGAASYTGTLSLANVQLEVGLVATPFEKRSLQHELAMCQRYFTILVNPALRGVMQSAALANRCGTALPTTMRAAPSVSTSGTGNMYDGSGLGSFSTVNIVYSTESYVELDIATASYSAQFRPAIAYIFSGATFTVSLSAEL